MKKGTNLLEGSIWKGIVSFAIPLFLGNLFQQLYNTADSLIVGNFLGSDALAAVSSSGSLIFLMVGFFNGIAVGAGVVISKYFGAADYEGLKKAVHTNIAFGLVSGCILTAVGMILAPQILVLMGTPESVLPNSIVYFRVYFAGSVAFVMYNIVMGILPGGRGQQTSALLSDLLIDCKYCTGFIVCRFTGIWRWCCGTCDDHLAVFQRIFMYAPSDAHQRCLSGTDLTDPFS